MDTTKPLELVPKRVGPPRLDPYQRLLGRFYEPLFLLKALGQTRDDHTPQPLDLDASQARRRRFLQNLSYICEFKKGGGACTAIGLEDFKTCYRFWVASNTENGRIVAFVRIALSALQETIIQGSTNSACKESAFTQLCVDFAAKRIKEENKFLRRDAMNCFSMLTVHKSETARKLQKWLKTAMSYDDNIQLCNFAYNNRHSVYMDELSSQALEEETRRGPVGRRSSFASVRHYIGRLAHHIRASKELVEDSYHMSHLLQTYTVFGINPLPSVPRPVRDSHTNLRGILNRMLKRDDEERIIIEDGLFYMNRVAGIFDEFVAQYDDSPLQVHAEVQVLEYFYSMGIAFAHNDRFIACSRPACLCCEMYFKYHPARMVLPPSHRKVWTKWSPPLLKKFDKDEFATCQQNQILIKMSHDLRERVKSQVLQRSRPNRWHPDSRTCITETPFPTLTSGSPEQPCLGSSSPRPIYMQAKQVPSNIKPAVDYSERQEEADLNGDVDSDDEGVSIYV